MKNRFMLAPLTNLQSNEDGTLSDQEFRWLMMRANGGFGLVMTCAAYVQPVGKGFPGQLGVFSDEHVAGLSRLAYEIRQLGSRAMLQLQHSGLRARPDLIGSVAPVGPSDDPESGARALTQVEVERLAGDFVAAAERADRAGFDGVELHAAHNYVFCQFLSAAANRREDRYGGSLDNRCRLLFDVLEGIRSRCRKEFLVSVRLSPERFGMTLTETPEIARRLAGSGLIDLLHLSLWDAFKEPEEEAFQGRTLLSWFTDFDRGPVRLVAVGKISTAAGVRAILEAGADIAAIGRAAILHHDFPRRCREDPGFEAVPLPVTPEYLHSEGVTDPFIGYLRNWEGFVA